MSASIALSNRQIFRAAGVVLLGFLASGVLGMVRTAVIAGSFGAGDALDAFYAAQRIPEIIFVLVAGGALGSSFIPVFERSRSAGDLETAWRLASAVMTFAALAAGALGLLVALLAPWLVPAALVPDKPPDVQALTVRLTQWMMVTPLIFSISGLLMGILQAHQRFLLPSLAISMNNVGLIVGALVFAPLLPSDPGVAQTGANNVYGLALGAVLSAGLHLAVQLPGLRALVRAGGRLRPLPDWRVPGAREVLLLMGPRILGLAVVQVNFVVNVVFTSGMVAGSLTVLTNAWTLMFFALGVIAQSVGTAVFPTLSALAASGDMDGFKTRLAAAMRGVLFLSFPVTAALIVLGEPLVRLLFERGEWTANDTAGTAWALALFAVGIAGFSLLEVLSRAFYALADTWTPVRVGLAAMVSNIVLSIILIRVIGDPTSLARGAFGGLALANAVTTLVEGLTLWWLLRRRIGGGFDRQVIAGAGRALLAAVVMGAALLGVSVLLGSSGALAVMLAGGVVGGAVFFGLGFALGLEEARTVPRLLIARLRRR